MAKNKGKPEHKQTKIVATLTFDVQQLNEHGEVIRSQKIKTETAEQAKTIFAEG